MNFKLLWIFVLSFILFSNFCFSIEVMGGEIFLIRPNNKFIDYDYIPYEYVSLEDLFFYTCIEETNVPVRSSVLCLDDTSFHDIELYKWGNSGNCYLGAFDFNKKECRNAVIETEYVKDDEVITISKDIKVNRFSSILEVVLDQQFSDGGWRDPIETASGIWVLSNYKDIFKDEILLANEWLKLYRNNDLKCWPDKSCSTLDTARILAYLTLGNVSDELRVMHDGNVFLKKKQSYYEEGEKWNLTINPFDRGDTNCLITYDKNHLNDEEFIINENETQTYTIDAFPTEKLIVICDRNIRATLKTYLDETTFVYEGDNLSYSMPYACWSEDSKWGPCDLKTTLYALMTNIDDERKDAAMKYVESLRVSGHGSESFIKSEDHIIETALYSYIIGKYEFNDYENEDLIAWLRFRQNNDGSWGKELHDNKIKSTAFSILSFLENDFSRNNQVIKDGEYWVNEEEIKISLNKTEEYLGWNSTEKNALAFTVLKNNARPLLKSSPMILILDKNEIEFDIFNPTVFPLNDVSYEFSSELEDLVELVNSKDQIRAYSYVKLNIKRTKTDAGNIFGFFKIFNDDQEIARIPVLMVNYPTIEINQKQDSLTIFGTSSKIEFDVTKTKHDFDCTLNWDSDEIKSKDEFKINSNSFFVDINFDNAIKSDDTYKGTFVCHAENEKFTIPFTIDIKRYPAFPFSLSTENIIINDSVKNPTFTIKNEIDESINVNIKFSKDDDYFDLSVYSKVIAPYEELNVTIFNNVPLDINHTQTNTIIVEALSESKTINFNTFVTDLRSKNQSSILYIILFLLIILIGVFAYFAYFYKDRLIALFKKEKNVDKIKMRIKKLEEREKKTAINNMITIMRMLNKDEKQIRSRLSEEGFLDEEINKAFETEMESEDEEEKK
ncbi:MAG: hypothetical protein ACLFPJ_01475 [Candidatus Woesearchaeota archaeon]